MSARDDYPALRDAGRPTDAILSGWVPQPEAQAALDEIDRLRGDKVEP